ncbi:peptidylprolyl isomerase [Inquilinus sp. OTU3971]|uniref:peptidylprolyl isomerase n=1 Tax=Inquilinus sp. OTU3971 TaxID=3043855 RepID=UPI00313DD156
MQTPIRDHSLVAGADGPMPTPSLAKLAPMPTVTVNGVAISRKAIAAEVQNFPGPDPRGSWEAAAQALAIRELLLQEAWRLEIPVEQRRDETGRLETGEDALVRALIEREIRTPEPDEQALRRVYETHRKRFISPTLYEADHILIAARRDDALGIAAARGKAAALVAVLAVVPERFAALARENSDCPSAALDGSLGQIGPGDTTPPFEEALARLEPGEISDPVETRYGIHLIRLNRRIDGRQLPFEVVRDRIAAYLTDRVRQQAQAQYVALLVGRADIRGIGLAAAASPLVQ